jgi:hypothetical protein
VLLESVLADTRRGRPGPEERYLGAVLLALGPSCQAPAPGLWSLATRGGSPAVQAAALVALSRFSPLDRPLPDPLLHSETPAIAGAILLAGLGGALPLARWLDERRPLAGRDLVLRAAFLAPGRIEAEDLRLREATRRFARQETATDDLRDAAALCLGNSPAPLETLRLLAPPPPEALLPFAFPPLGRAAAQRAGWLVADPPRRLSPQQRAALVVEYVLAGDLDFAPATLRAWSGEPELGGVAALAIAWRLIRHDAKLAPELRPELGTLPERALVELACGAPGDAPIRLGDPELDRAAQLARDGRLPLAGLLDPIEAALWRRGAHPGAVARAAWFALVRDLLLGGSDFVANRLGRAGPPLPPGVNASNEMLFSVAYDWFEWRLRCVPAPADGFRLR